MTDRSGGLLLDTSAVIAHLRGRIDLFAQTTAGEQLYLPLMALGELLKGIEKAERPDRQRQLVNGFLENVSLVYPAEATAECYAKIAAELERKGKYIPENDLWIAAMALESDLPLAARDAHFSRVQGLLVIPC